MKPSLLSFNIAKHLELADMLELAKSKGFVAVEFRGDAEHKHGVEVERAKAERAEIRRQVADAGLDIACLATGTRYESPDPQERAENVQRAKEFVELAHDLGCGRIRVFGNAFPKGVEKPDVVQWVGESLRELGEFAEGAGVDVLLEMHGDFYYWEYALKAVQIADHARVGIVHNSDPRDPEDGTIKKSYNAVRPHVRHVHMHELCDMRFPYDEFFGYLKADGYDGYMSAEIKESSDPERVLDYYMGMFNLLRTLA